jgi:hypothetical protein
MTARLFVPLLGRPSAAPFRECHDMRVAKILRSGCADGWEQPNGLLSPDRESSQAGEFTDFHQGHRADHFSKLFHLPSARAIGAF